MTPLTDQQRAALHVAARAAVEAAVRGDEPPRPPAGGVLDEPRGAFVSLHGPGERLRGCLGAMLAVDPLGQTVVRMAGAAACRDPRFSPVAPDELPGLTIEISVLTPFQPEADLPGAVTPGQDGLLVEGRGRRGVLLPQVARDHGWDAETFLDQTCVKAGLAPGTWRDPDVTVSRFQAEVF